MNQQMNELHFVINYIVVMPILALTMRMTSSTAETRESFCFAPNSKRNRLLTGRAIDAERAAAGRNIRKINHQTPFHSSDFPDT